MEGKFALREEAVSSTSAAKAAACVLLKYIRSGKSRREFSRPLKMTAFLMAYFRAYISQGQEGFNKQLDEIRYSGYLIQSSCC